MPTNLLAPVAPDVGAISLADAPDQPTAIAAGMAHGLTAREALTAAFGKWMSENVEAVELFGLANFYAGAEASQAMVNYSLLTQFLCVTVMEQHRQIAELRSAVDRMKAGPPAAAQVQGGP